MNCWLLRFYSIVSASLRYHESNSFVGWCVIKFLDDVRNQNHNFLCDNVTCGRSQSTRVEDVNSVRRGVNLFMMCASKVRCAHLSLWSDRNITQLGAQLNSKWNSSKWNGPILHPRNFRVKCLSETHELRFWHACMCLCVWIVNSDLERKIEWSNWPEKCYVQPFTSLCTKFRLLLNCYVNVKWNLLYGLYKTTTHWTAYYWFSYWFCFLRNQFWWGHPNINEY